MVINKTSSSKFKTKKIVFSLSIDKKSFLFWQQTDHKYVCVIIFYGYDNTEIPYSKDDEINEGREAIIKASLIRRSAAKQKKGSHG